MLILQLVYKQFLQSQDCTHTSLTSHQIIAVGGECEREDVCCVSHMFFLGSLPATRDHLHFVSLSHRPWTVDTFMIKKQTDQDYKQAVGKKEIY